MQLYQKQFLGSDAGYSSFDEAKVIVVPVPYEGGITYGIGAAKGPDAILDASCHVELYDEVLNFEPHTIGICTVEPPPIPQNPEAMVQNVFRTIETILNKGKFPVVIGGDHSITTGFCRAIQGKFDVFSVIQLDAHADLRETYEGSSFSHACVMSRLREMTRNTLQIGIRSFSAEEAKRIQQEHISICTMNNFRKCKFDLESALKALPDPAFITFDVDVLDWSVVRSTGTPEPGGLTWDETNDILQMIFSRKNVVGFDLVELAHQEADPNSAFAAAKLIYKMIGWKFHPLFRGD